MRLHAQIGDYDMTDIILDAASRLQVSMIVEIDYTKFSMPELHIF